jgi:ATP-dependent RNA helicase DeaD
VPEKDAKKVMIQLTGIRYKGRTVRCNDADEGGKNPRETAAPSTREKRSRRDSQPKRQKEEMPKRQKKDDWRSLMRSTEGRLQGKNKVPRDLKGPEPDFSEEGWAMRKPRKKKK